MNAERDDSGSLADLLSAIHPAPRVQPVEPSAEKTTVEAPAPSRTWRAQSPGTVAPSAPLAPVPSGPTPPAQHLDSAAKAQSADTTAGNSHPVDAAPRGASEWVSTGKTLVIGAREQFGYALQGLWLGRDDVRFVDRDEVDLGRPETIDAFNFAPYSTIVNVSGYTDVDGAETAEGRRAAWAENVTGVAALACVVRALGATLVHISSDHVFDGSCAIHAEDEEFAPLNVCGQTKAAGEAIVAGLDHHYILRTSWVVSEGHNFVRAMREQAEQGGSPRVVCDQIGRLTFAAEVARAIEHLVRTEAAYGTYNVSNSGEPLSRYELARKIFELTGNDPDRVVGVSTVEYSGDVAGMAQRPLNSVFALEKLEATGFTPQNQCAALEAYLRA